MQKKAVLNEMPSWKGPIDENVSKPIDICSNQTRLIFPECIKCKLLDVFEWYYSVSGALNVS